MTITRCKAPSDKIPVSCMPSLSILSCAERPSSTNRTSKYQPYGQEITMKYVCLGYMEEKKWDAMSQSERETFMDECFAYDEELEKNGHFVGGEALQSVQNATTLRWRHGKVSITDGPFAET